MDENAVMQAVVVQQAQINPEDNVTELALFNSDGSPRSGADAVIAPVVTATAIGTATKVTASPLPKTNTLVPVQFTNGNSANTPTLTFATGGAIPMKLGGTASATAKLVVAANGIVLFYFDGATLHQIGTMT